MSYNVTDWKTKKLENLRIPLAAFYTHARTDFHPDEVEVFNAETNEVILHCRCETTIHGELTDGVLTVREFEIYEEGSGVFVNEVLYHALEQSSGHLEAVLVWEGGDSIERLAVDDGDVFMEEVNL